MADEHDNQLAEHPERQAGDDFDMEALEEKVGAGLAALNSGEDVMEAVAAVSSDDEDETDDAGEDAGADDSEGSDEDGGDEETGEEAATDDEGDEFEEDSDAASSDVPTLPDAYRRSLHARGWTDDTIDKNLEMYGADFLRTAHQIHDSRTQELAAWANMGRQARDGQQPDPNQQAQPDPTQTPVQPTPAGGLSPIDTAALKEKYGDDALIDEIVGPVNKVINSINAVIPQLQAGQVTVENAEQERLGRLVTEFFGGDSMKSYASLYGGDTPDAGQIDKRREVLELADAMAYGAAAQNRPMSIEDALMNAHDIVSAGFREEQVRTKIKGQVQKRARGVTLKPGGKRKSSSSGRKSRTETERENKIGAKMEEVFGVPNA